MVSVSVDGCCGPTLEGGLTQEAFDAFRPELVAAHRELMSRRDTDIGFYDAPFLEGMVRKIGEEAARLRALGDDLLVLGIGGSSLGGQALLQALGRTSDRPVDVTFLDNVDPDSMKQTLEVLDPKRTVCLVVTKSGATVETLAQYLVVRRWLSSSLGQGETRSRLSFITDPDKGVLRQIANEEGIRCFEIPPNVGGRFSVLSPVGLLPSAFVGVDIEELVAGARSMQSQVVSDSIDDNPACSLAAAATLLTRDRNCSQVVFMPYADSLRTLSSWFVQLWAESLGKKHNRSGEVVYNGSTPIPAVGATDQHAQVQLFVEGPRDKVVFLVTVDEFATEVEIPDEHAQLDDLKYLHGRSLNELLQAERRATRAALLDAGVPVCDISLPRVDPRSVGALLMLLEATCATTGMTMGINPFDQPGVEAGKLMAFGLLGRAGFEEHAQRVFARETKPQE